MTRFEAIQAHLREVGPQSTQQLADHFGWRMRSASPVISHARSYGYIEPHGTIPARKNGSASPMTIWRHREKIIRYPSESRQEARS